MCDVYDLLSEIIIVLVSATFGAISYALLTSRSRKS
jgi:hypothetical protein